MSLQIRKPSQVKLGLERHGRENSGLLIPINQQQHDHLCVPYAFVTCYIYKWLPLRRPMQGTHHGGDFTFFLNIGGGSSSGEKRDNVKVLLEVIVTLKKKEQEKVPRYHTYQTN